MLYPFSYGWSQTVAGDYSSIVTVVAPAANYDLSDLASVKTVLGITDNSQDAKLTSMISAVSKSFLSIIGRVLAQETVTEKFRITGQVNKLQLSRYPVAPDAITAVTEDGTLLDNTEYEVDPNSGLFARINSDFPCPWCSRVVSVSYQGGYATPPADLAQEVAMQVNHAKSLAGRDPNAKMIQIPDILTQEFWVGDSNSSVTGLPANTVSILSGYRTIRG